MTKEKQMKDSVSNQEEKRSLELEGRKVVLTASIISILVVLSVFNQNIFAPSKSATHQGREIACDSSSGFCPEVAPINTEWEYKLARQMAQNDTGAERDLSSIGQMPSALEQFRFGLLENKYRFNFSDGKISSIQFPETSPDRPKYINERAEFLNKYSNLFSVSFKSTELALKETSGENVKETYSLLDSDRKPAGQAVIVTDQYGRLISLDVTK